MLREKLSYSSAVGPAIDTEPSIVPGPSGVFAGPPTTLTIRAEGLYQLITADSADQEAASIEHERILVPASLGRGGR
jgi:hypothetical protein